MFISLPILRKYISTWVKWSFLQTSEFSSIIWKYEKKQREQPRVTVCMFKVAQREGAIGEANRLLQKERWNAGDRGGREGGGWPGSRGAKRATLLLLPSRFSPWTSHPICHNIWRCLSSLSIGCWKIPRISLMFLSKVFDHSGRLRREISFGLMVHGPCVHFCPALNLDQSRASSNVVYI